MQTANKILTNKRILIIDDDQFSILLTKLKLKDYCDASDITVSYSISDAIAYLEDTEKNKPAMMPELIFLETAINDSSGWDFITYFEKRGKGTHHQAKLVILTSSQFFSDFRRATKSDCVTGFLVKPLQTNLLFELLTPKSDKTSISSQVLINSLIN
jgi:CheY-like chemotaxis protein